jgi:hypothetical protein
MPAAGSEQGAKQSVYACMLVFNNEDAFSQLQVAPEVCCGSVANG